jgi:hypothetical protein
MPSSSSPPVRPAAAKLSPPPPRAPAVVRAPAGMRPRAAVDVRNHLAQVRDVVRLPPTLRRVVHVGLERVAVPLQILEVRDVGQALALRPPETDDRVARRCACPGTGCADGLHGGSRLLGRLCAPRRRALSRLGSGRGSRCRRDGGRGDDRGLHVLDELRVDHAVLVDQGADRVIESLPRLAWWIVAPVGGLPEAARGLGRRGAR